MSAGKNKKETNRCTKQTPREFLTELHVAPPTSGLFFRILRQSKITLRKESTSAALWKSLNTFSAHATAPAAASVFPVNYPAKWLFERT
jgi:hypothetical protein